MKLPDVEPRGTYKYHCALKGSYYLPRSNVSRCAECDMTPFRIYHIKALGF
jgi:hypothetical protein